MTASTPVSLPVAPDYGWQSGDYTRAHDYIRPVVLRTIASLAERAGTSGRPIKVFDAGCGNGAMLRAMSRLGYLVAGCEGSLSGVTQAREQCAPTVRIEQLSLYDDLAAEFGTDWDVVVSTEVIEHLYAPRTFVDRVADMLVPGGALIISTPYHGYAKNLVLAASGAMDRHFTALWDGGHIKFWSYRTLRQLLSEAGFCGHNFQGAGRLPWLWKSMVVTSRKVGQV